MKYVQPVGGPANDPYVDANPVGGIEGSAVPAASIEHPMRELVALITNAGLAPTDADLTQVATAVRTLIQKQAPSVSAAGGTANALNGTYVPAIGALTNGMTLYVRAGSASTTTTPTFTPASGTIAAKTIVKGNGLALAAGDIAGGGHWIELQYDLALDKWVLLNPATGINTGLTQAQADARYTGIGCMVVEHQLAQGTNAGATISGINQRPLNTVVANTISGASLSGNQITLPAGTYRLRGSFEAFHCNGSKVALYNVTDAVYVAQGMSINGENTAPDIMGWSIPMNARFVIAAPKVFEIRQFSEIAATNGFGFAVNSMGVEVYASVEINKE